MDPLQNIPLGLDRYTQELPETLYIMHNARGRYLSAVKGNHHGERKSFIVAFKDQETLTHFKVGSGYLNSFILDASCDIESAIPRHELSALARDRYHYGILLFMDFPDTPLIIQC